MITPKWQEELSVALSYFEEHLGPGRYYGAGSLYRGQWFGKGALKLGLDGTIDKVCFQRLCNNQDPRTGHRLTPRQRADRRIFCDFVISPPKGFSILALLGGDARLIALHRQTALLTGRELEQFAMCRMRQNDRDDDAETANVIGAQFTDPCSRALDPHLHDHLVIFNATFDEATGSWKALQNSEMLRAQKYVESVYYHYLVQGLRRLGYEICPLAGRTDFEIADLDPSIIAKFSKRHAEIQNSASQLAKGQGGNVKDHAEMLAHHMREPKQKDLTREDLLARWRAELTTAENEHIQSLVAIARAAPARNLAHRSPSAAVCWALDHVLERRAVVRDHEVLHHALDYARGSDLDLAALETAFSERKDVLRAGRAVTTAEVLATETKLLDMAREGKGKHPPLASRSTAPAEPDEEQVVALNRILASTDEHIILRGGAGTGKSTLLKSFCSMVAGQHMSVVVLAPQAQQVRGLADDGLPSPQTLASVLRTGHLPAGAVVVADEAGQIGSISLLKLFRLCRSHGCRLVLSGDIRQHGPVERGDALRSLQKYAQVETISLNKNRRQDPRRAGDQTEAERIALYRESVQAAARGDLTGSLHLLDQCGGLREAASDKLELIANLYLKLSRKGDAILAVSQTRSEVSLLNNAIRTQLQMRGLLGRDTWETTALIARDYTEAQKQDARSYAGAPGLSLHSNMLGWKAGTTLEVVQARDEGVVVRTSRGEYLIPWNESAKWQVCDRHVLKLAPGDRLQLRRNQRSVAGKDALVNGEIVMVDHVLKDGAIRLKDGRSLPPEYRTFQLGYATTSYGGQGKTVDHVLVSDSGVKAATNARQWYVDISRGRRSATIFTNDKSGLIKRISQPGGNPLAIEVFPNHVTALAPRAGLRSRMILKDKATRWLRRRRRFVRQCCRYSQVWQALDSTKRLRAAQMTTPVNQVRAKTR